VYIPPVVTLCMESSLYIKYLLHFSILESHHLHQTSVEAILHLNNHRAGNLNYPGNDVKLIYKCRDEWHNLSRNRRFYRALWSLYPDQIPDLHK
jgi:hypothetical protein